VRHVSGEFKQVGHNCVRDFLGHVNPKHLAKMMEYISLFEASQGEDEDFCGGRSGRWLDYTVDYVALCAEVIKRDGWVSRTASQAYAAKANGIGLPTTSDIAWAYLHPHLKCIEPKIS